MWDLAIPQRCEFPAAFVEAKTSRVLFSHCVSAQQRKCSKNEENSTKESGPGTF